MNQSILLLGDLNLDVVMSASDYPPVGGEIMAKCASLHSGGGVINTAVQLARFGTSPSVLIACGNDSIADQALGPLHQAGIDLTHIVRRDGTTTGITFIIVTPDGERTMFTSRGANSAFRPEDIPPGVVESSGFLHLSGYALRDEPQSSACRIAIQRARAVGVPVCLDLPLPVVRERENVARQIIPELTVLISGLEEARILTGKDSPEECAAVFIEMGMHRVGIKLGNQGCVVAESGSIIRVDKFQVAAMDTTGAGDSFSAGMILACLWKLRIKSSAVLAAALGALATTVAGAGVDLPGKNSLVQLLDEQVDEETRNEIVQKAGL